MFTLKIGSKKTTHATIKEARDAHNAKRDASGQGASRWPRATIADGNIVYHVSYNGRVWDRDYARDFDNAVEIKVS